MFKMRTLILALVVLTTSLSSAMTRRDLLPAGALASVHVSDTTEFLNKLKLSSLGKLWADEQFQDFLGNPTTDDLLESFFKGEMDAEDRVFIDQCKMLTGELLLTFHKDTDKFPHIIAAISAENYKLSLELDDKLKDVLETPHETKKTTFQGVEIIEYIQDPGTLKEYSFWQAFHKDTILVGPTLEWIERSIVKLQKDELTEPEGNPTLRVDIPLGKMLYEIFKEEEEGNGNHSSSVDNTELILKALGLAGIENFSSTIELKDNELVADGVLRVDDLTKGLLTIIDPTPSKLPDESFIPANTSAIEIGRINLLGFWQELPQMITAISPGGGPQFAMLVSMLEQNAGIRIEQDFLANMNSRYVSFAVAGEDAENSVMIFELNDSSAFKSALETLMAAPTLQAQISTVLETETFRDHTIYSLKEGTDASFTTFSVIDGYFVFGQPSGVRQVLRLKDDDSLENGFESSRLMDELRRHVPARAFAYSATDWKKSMSALVYLLKKPEYYTGLMGALVEYDLSIPPPDVDKLPSAEHIASFFNLSCQYTEATGEGIHARAILTY